MQQRLERTVRRPVTATGVGFLTGADVTVRFLPAPAGHGIAFRRVDCPGARPIPALIEFALPRERRTALGRDGVVVEMTEHVLAALAGLHIDNCLIELDAPELPGGDGSSLHYTEALLDAGFEEQDRLRESIAVEHPLRVEAADGKSELAGRPLGRPSLAITYQLDYGPRSPIPAQNLTVEITPENFLRELAFARTFLLEAEAEALRQQGYGSRTTFGDLLVFGPDGVVGNSLRAADECVRHKILDCVGDFALLGADLRGHITAYRSGHHLNRELVQRLRQSQNLPRAGSAGRVA